MPVDRCVCRSLPFESLKAIAAARSLDFDGLKAATGCCTGCSLCEPYVRLMLQTGRTSFQPLPMPPTNPPRPT
jgi:bacterioferritin-associated ferredoxin